MSPKKTVAQIALDKAIETLEWARTMFDESVVPQVVDVDALMVIIESAVRQRRHEVLCEKKLDRLD